MDPCLTIIGKVSWTDYVNNDGDALFNVVSDPPFEKYPTSGNFAPSFITKYHVPAIHMEVVCQGPVTVPDNSTLKRYTCDGYNGPIFTNLPKPGQ